MKKTIIISAMLLAVVVIAVTAGAPVSAQRLRRGKKEEEKPKPKPKFPYVSEELNKPCGKTMFEWRCMKNSIQSKPKRIKLNKQFDMIHIVAEPQPKGLKIVAVVTRRKRIRITPRDKNWKSVMFYTAGNVLWEAQGLFGDKKGKDGLFADARDIRIEVYLDYKLVVIKDFKGTRLAR